MIIIYVYTYIYGDRNAIVVNMILSNIIIYEFLHEIYNNIDFHTTFLTSS